MPNPLTSLFDSIRGAITPQPAPEAEPVPDNLAGMTLRQMRESSTGAIRKAVADYLAAMNKKTLIETLLDITEEAGDPIIERDEKGRITSRLVKVRDVLGNVIRGERMTRSYYTSGEIDEIDVEELDAKLKPVRGKIIKHSIDSKTQPVVTAYQIGIGQI